MSKKNTPTTKVAAPAKRAAKPAAKKQPAAPKVAAVKPVAVKPAKVTKEKTATNPKAIAAKTPGFTRDDIALRAYFIAEKRRHLGLPGDESHDWIEAERQLLAESKSVKKSPVRKATAK